MSYIPHSNADRQAMLAEIGVESLEELFVDVPESVRYPEVKLPRPLSEMEILAELQAMSEQNADLNHYACFLGAGAYDHFVPIVVGSVGHLHTRQGTDHALVLKDGLQGALAHLGLVGRVGGVELGAARYMLHHAGHEMIVGPCPQEASVVVEVGVLLAQGLQFRQNLHL